MTSERAKLHSQVKLQIDLTPTPIESVSRHVSPQSHNQSSRPPWQLGRAAPRSLRATVLPGRLRRQRGEIPPSFGDAPRCQCVRRPTLRRRRRGRPPRPHLAAQVLLQRLGGGRRPSLVQCGSAFFTASLNGDWNSNMPLLKQLDTRAPPLPSA